MEWTRENRIELERRRQNIKNAARTCAINKYDGSCLVEPYAKCCEILWKIGGRPVTPDYCTAEYWQDPERSSNDGQCKNRVLQVTDDFLIIRERPVHTGKSPMRPRTTTIERPKVQQIASESTTELEKGHYKLNISWTEHPEIDRNIITKLQTFFEDLGLKQIETTSFDNGIVKEQTIEYVFEGSYDSYLMLRRASLAMLDVLNDSDEFRIVIHGKNKI